MLIRLEQVTMSVSVCEMLVSVLHDADEDDERIRARLLDVHYTAYAAYVGEQLVGAVVMRWDEDAGEIEYIAVDSACRGRGYGKAMVAQILMLARRRGVHTVLVGTANSSLENIAFYQKCGFRMDHVCRDYFAYVQPPVIQNGIVMRDMLVLRYSWK
jgi:ribosomal protein S18 acetylase RimI-like enzyme